MLAAARWTIIVSSVAGGAEAAAGAAGAGKMDGEAVLATVCPPTGFVCLLDLGSSVF